MKSSSPFRSHPSLSPLSLSTHRIPLALLAAVGGLVGGVQTSAWGQAQSLSFTAGVLLNSKVSFHGLGAHAATSQPGPSTGGAADRTYDDGFVKVDAQGNPQNTTVHWGYQSAEQLRGERVYLTSRSAPGDVSLEDSGDFLAPSANLEYRGSLGSLGDADWGVVLGIGYASLGAEESGSFATAVNVVEDSYSIGSTALADIPSAPYAGDPNASGPSITSEPRRTALVLPGARLLSGRWAFDADLFPVTGGLYLERQLVGRLNGIASAGVLAMFVNSRFEFKEQSVINGLRDTSSASGRESDSSFIFGGFVGLGLDWAIWENASLVAAARWQPTETFSQDVRGREVEMDFTSAFAVHAGFSMRF